MNIRKIFLNILAASLIMSSCSEDYLDKQPLDAMSNGTYWKTSDEAIMAVNACYKFFGDEWWKTFLTCATDDSYSWSDWPSDIRLAGNGSATTNSGTFGHFWNFYYQAIASANTVNDNISKVSNIDEALRKRLAAEARFVRAYAYQQLIGLYGDVPLITKVPALSEFYPVRTPRAEVAQFIVSDIDDFVKDLPVTYEASADFGRVTQGAALALKARILLYEGKWVDAASAAQAAMDLKKYSIEPNYESLFNGTNEKSNEIILAAQYVAGTYTSSITTWVGGPAVDGWSQVVPLQSLVDAYECTDGKTIDQSSVYDPAKPFENRDPRLKKTIIVPGSVLNGKVIDVSAPNSPDGLGKNNASYSGYYYKKYIPTVISGGWDGNSANDIIVLRYAEVLLTYAEGKIEANQIDQSVYDAINAVRGRADVNMPIISAGKSQSELREILRRERRVEFANEEQRLFDIRRWKIAETVMPGYIYGILNYWDNKRDDFGKHVVIEERKFRADRDYLWPIPQSEADLNKKLVQNPNW